MSVGRENKKMVNLNPLELIMQQSKDMTLFIIIDYQLVNYGHPAYDLVYFVVSYLQPVLEHLPSSYYHFINHHSS